jgi:hypothetical protein
MSNQQSRLPLCLSTRAETARYKEARGPMVVLWDSLTDEGKTECLEELKTTNDWVICRKDSRKWDEDLMSYLTEVGREEFRGRAVRGQEEQKATSDEETPLQGRAQKGRGWCRWGDAGAYLNGNGMKCWVHKDTHRVRDEVMQKVQDAWDDVTEKDTCTRFDGPGSGKCLYVRIAYLFASMSATGLHVQAWVLLVCFYVWECLLVGIH